MWHTVYGLGALPVTSSQQKETQSTDPDQRPGLMPSTTITGLLGEGAMVHLWWLSPTPVPQEYTLAHGTSRLVFTARLHPQVRIPPVRDARRTSCPIPSSERAQIPNFQTCSIPNLWTHPMLSFFNVSLCSAPMSYLAGSKLGRPLCYGHAAVRWCLQQACAACGGHIALDGGCHVHNCVMVLGADFKMCLLRQFCSNRVEFFTIHRRHRHQKWWTRILKFEFCEFWEFF